MPKISGPEVVKTFQKWGTKANCGRVKKKKKRRGPGCDHVDNGGRTSRQGGRKEKQKGTGVEKIRKKREKVCICFVGGGGMMCILKGAPNRETDSHKTVHWMALQNFGSGKRGDRSKGRLSCVVVFSVWKKTRKPLTRGGKGTKGLWW